MRESPILFSGPMVRAILDGRKTQTRRPIKGIDPDCLEETMSKAQWARVNRERPAWFGASYLCPYGQPGDRLWVRETCRAHERNDGLDGVLYPADNAFVPIAGTNESVDRWITLNSYRGARGATVPAIHMPRWASRITLEIAGVRVERLQDISEADAAAEGIDKTAAGFWSTYGQREVDGTYSPRASYQCLWDSLNAARGHGWDANPWVWVVEFKRIASPAGD